jgi:tryptophanyl-tRNA synthetase
MVTDPARKRRTDPGTPEKCPVFDLHKAFSTPETQAWAAEGCRTAGIGCLDCKSKLADHLVARLLPLHEKRRDYAAHPDTVWDVLREGGKRARTAAEATMQSVRAAVKLAY